jgi:Putative Actinobacterial Holin-X, holin superfamily III
LGCATVDINLFMAEPRDEPVADLLRDLGHELTALVHHELDLARAELVAKGRRAGLGAAVIGGAGSLAALATGAMVSAAIVALAGALTLWAAALVVGAVLAVLGGAFAVLGFRKIAQVTPPVPAKAVESTKEDVEWIKAQMRSARP